MDIIKYGNLYKKEKKVKAKCPHCGTKVAMIKEDYQLYDFQTNMIWDCPFCQKRVITKRFNSYRIWHKITNWFRVHDCASLVILAFGITATIITIFVVLAISCYPSPDGTDNYLIDYYYEDIHYEEYVDNYKLEGSTLYVWDDGEKTQYNGVKFNRVITLREENNGV